MPSGCAYPILNDDSCLDFSRADDYHIFNLKINERYPTEKEIGTYVDSAIYDSAGFPLQRGLP